MATWWGKQRGYSPLPDFGLASFEAATDREFDELYPIEPPSAPESRPAGHAVASYAPWAVGGGQVLPRRAHRRRARMSRALVGRRASDPEPADASLVTTHTMPVLISTNPFTEPLDELAPFLDELAVSGGLLYVSATEADEAAAELPRRKTAGPVVRRARRPQG